jgi:hypothetical protein
VVPESGLVTSSWNFDYLDDHLRLLRRLGESIRRGLQEPNDSWDSSSHSVPWWGFVPGLYRAKSDDTERLDSRALVTGIVE